VPSDTGTAPSVALGDSDLRVTAGSAVGISGRGFAADTALTVTLHSTPVRLASITTDADGAYAAQVTIPASTEAGAHRIVVTAANGDSAEIAFTVVAAGSGSSLANTGVGFLTPMLGGAFALLAAGAGALFLRRRQQA
jgi:LPXTG-motif cell wall-anchored protein